MCVFCCFFIADLIENSVFGIFEYAIFSSVNNFSKINVAKWNQLTINYLIDSFRIDTCSFIQLKQPPPVKKVYAYSYPNHANVFNNDFATVWNFINKRNCILNTIDSLHLACSDSLQIVEFYKFDSPTIYEISDNKTFFKIILYQDCSKSISKIDGLTELISGFEDNRGIIAPIRTLTIKTIIFKESNESDDFTIETLYIDSSQW